MGVRIMIRKINCVVKVMGNKNKEILIIFTGFVEIDLIKRR